MRNTLCFAALAGLLLTAAGPARAADDKPEAVLDKAIKALGGEANLTKHKGATWKGKGTVNIMGNENAFTFEGASLYPNRYRNEAHSDFGKYMVILNGDKGWIEFGGNLMELDKDGLANQKRETSLTILSTLIVPLKSKDFKIAAAGEEKVDGKPAVALKVTPPDGKEFTIAFDKESGLPVKVAAKVAGFMGEEVAQEIYASNYKDVQGVKKAMKVLIKRNGEKFLEQEITEYKLVDKLDDKLFEKP